MILKTSRNIEFTIRSGKGRVGLGGSGRAGHDRSELDGSKIDGGEIDGGKIGDDEVEKKVQKSSKSKNLSKSKKIVGLDFLTPGAKLAFIKLRQAFVKALILNYFDPEDYIYVKTDALGDAIGRVLSQQTLNNLDRWYPVVFFHQKMTPAKTRYKTHDSELLATVEAFKTWKHYLKGFWHEVFVLTDHNNLWQFIETKSLSLRQVR